jgi:hypothetical protein
MSSSGIAYPPPTYIPPLPIFNPTNFPPIPPSGSTSGGGGQSNIFPDGLSSGNVIQLDGGTGGSGGTGTERSINGISYLNFIDTANTSPVGATPLTTLSQTTTTFTIGGNNDIEIDITGSALKFNGVAVGTGSGNVNTANSNTYATGTTQTFDSAVVDNNLSFNTNSEGILMSSNNGFNSANLYFPYPFPSTSDNGKSGMGLYWNNSLGAGETDLICYGGLSTNSGLSIYAVPYNINPVKIADFWNQGITFYKSLQTTSYISSPTLTTAPSLPSTYGSFYIQNQTPYFTYNNAGTITTSPLLTSASLSNYGTLNGTQYWTGQNTFNNGISLPNVSNPPPSGFLYATLYSYNNTLNYSTAGSVIVNPVALTRTANTFSGTNNFTGTTTAITPSIGDNSTNIATTAFVQSALQTYSITSGVGVYIPATTNPTAPAQTAWTFTFGSPNYGNTFRFVITTNTTPTPIALQTGLQPLPQPNGTNGCMTGNGILQTYTSSPISTVYNAYYLSNINTLSIPFNISTSEVNAGTWLLTIVVYNQNIPGYTLDMNITTTS